MERIQIVCACILKDNEVLIAKRKSHAYNGIWEFCGGKVEANETLLEAIQREVKEELDIVCDNYQYLTSIYDDTKDIPLEVHAFTCQYLGDEIHPSAHSELFWCTPEAIEISKFHTSDKPIIDKLIEFLNKESN